MLPEKPAESPHKIFHEKGGFKHPLIFLAKHTCLWGDNKSTGCPLLGGDTKIWAGNTTISTKGIVRGGKLFLNTARRGQKYSFLGDKTIGVRCTASEGESFYNSDDDRNFGAAPLGRETQLGTQKLWGNKNPEARCSIDRKPQPRGR